MPFWHINGELTTAGIEQQLTEAKTISGYGGVAVLPVTEGRQWKKDGFISPGTEPEYLSDEYFRRYDDILRISKNLGLEVILYDDIDFPSGSAGGRLQKEYPEFTQKELIKHEFDITGPQKIKRNYSDMIRQEELMAVSAMNKTTLEIIDLENFIHNHQLEWNVPAGEWRILFFTCKYNVNRRVDYMQPEAVRKLISMTYDEYAKRFSHYFGNVITKTFYDDVGFVHHENIWNPKITEIFKEKHQKNPALYYPALFYDIGPETHFARIAFYDIRSELMAEGYTKQVAEWSARHNLKSMGHPPENYSPNSVVAHGDILKFYRHTHIPLMDAIFFYGRGIHGFKQISSAADIGDKPVVGAEIYGAFPETMDSLTLYRVAMEVLARGVNFVVPHGMWYNPDADKIRIPPLVSHENPLLGNLSSYSSYIARCCMLLQGGSRVSDIALLWPIAAVQAESYINRDAESGLPVANWLPEGVNHHEISNLLTNELYRDFTFIHPEDLTSERIIPEDTLLKLNNKENIQHYNTLIIPGSEIISTHALTAIKSFYDNGGKIIAASLLPNRSAEFGKDHIVDSLIFEIFGINSSMAKPEQDITVSNSKGGKACFLHTLNKESLENAFRQMNLSADVMFESTVPDPDTGYINYVHKQKDGKEIYFISNSTNHRLETKIKIRGTVVPELWDPHSGNTTKIQEYQSLTENKVGYTTFDLSLTPVSSVFIVGKKK